MMMLRSLSRNDSAVLTGRRLGRRGC